MQVKSKWRTVLIFAPLCAERGSVTPNIVLLRVARNNIGHPNIENKYYHNLISLYILVRNPSYFSLDAPCFCIFVIRLAHLDS